MVHVSDVTAALLPLGNTFSLTPARTYEDDFATQYGIRQSHFVSAASGDAAGEVGLSVPRGIGAGDSHSGSELSSSVRSSALSGALELCGI